MSQVKIKPEIDVIDAMILIALTLTAKSLFENNTKIIEAFNNFNNAIMSLLTDEMLHEISEELNTVAFEAALNFHKRTN
jgi:hypothetical protein